MPSRLAFTIIAFFIFNHSRAQDIRIKDLYGEWHVTKWIWFTNSEFSETKAERLEREADQKKCFRALVKITHKGISFSGDACQSDYLSSCGTELFSTAAVKKMRLVPDKIDTLDINGVPLVEDDAIGRKFTRLIEKDFNGDSLYVVQTKCKADWGSETYKIYFVNKLTIGIYSGADLLVLQRGAKKKQ